MRGKVWRQCYRDSSIGITPAYAGKSFRHFLTVFIREDHPRLCGEKLISGEDVSLALGSPPPMRGKGYSVPQFISGDGITPAYAGKSSRRSRFLVAAWDHPRLCGEKFASPAPRVNGIGSPPPMRGKGLCVLMR